MLQRRARSATRAILTALVAITAMIATASITEAAPLPSPVGNAATALRGTTLNGPSLTFTNAELDALYPGGSTIMTPENIVAALTQLEADVAHTPVNGGTANTYSDGKGFSITLPSATAFQTAAATDGRGVKLNADTVTPDFAYCYCGGREILTMNTADQNMILNVGAAAAGIALCAIPLVGQIACVVITMAMTVTGSYLIRNGICSGGRNLYWYNVSGGSTVRCLSARPSSW